MQAPGQVVAVVGAVPQALVVVELAVLEAPQHLFGGEQAGRPGEGPEVLVEALDELPMRPVHGRRGLVQPLAIARLPVEQAAALVDFLAVQADAAHQLAQYLR